MSKSICLTILSIFYVSIFLFVILVIANTANKVYNDIVTDINQNDRKIRNNFYSEDYAVPKGKHICVKNKTYPVTPGSTFYIDKGNPKLYADLKFIDGKIFMKGKEFHNGGQLVDGTINDTFIYDIETDSYINETGDIIISNYDSIKFTINDKRTTVCLPFNGTLSLIQ